MAKYMLSVHSSAPEEEEAAPVGEPMSQEEMQLAYKRVTELESDMRTAGAFLFSGRLHDPDTATVLRHVDGETLTTDGPFVESKEHLAGFYLIEAADLDEAMSWASRTVEIIGAPLEVRPLWDESHG